MVYVPVNADAFPIQLLVGNRFLVWQEDCFYGDWYFACVPTSGQVAVGTEPWDHGTILLPSRLLCNRPDKEEWLLISAAQRLRTSGVTGQVPSGTGPRRSSFR